MIKYNIVITTIDRMNDSTSMEKREKTGLANYLGTSLQSLLHNADFEQAIGKDISITVYDSGSTNPGFLNTVRKRHPKLNFVTAPSRLTLVGNANWAIHNAALRPCKYVILMQDDIVFAKNAYWAIDRWIQNAPKDAGILSLWHCGKASKKPYVSLPPEDYWGNLFIIMKPADVLQMLSWKGMRIKGNGHDMSVKDWAIEHKKKIYVNPAGLIDHIGHYSTLGTRPERTQKFKGEGYDVRNL